MELIGERLRLRREEMGLTIEQAAEATKFPAEVITAVEEGRVGIFSAKVYHIAFIRAYARFLKLDADELVRNQKSEEERAQEALRGIRTVPEKSGSPRRTLVMIAAVVALAIVALVVSNRVFQSKRGESGEAARSAEASSAPAGRERLPKGTPRMVPVEIPPEPTPAADTAGGQVASGGAGAEPGSQAQAAAQQSDSAGADSTKPAGPAIVPGTNWPIIPAGPKRAEQGVRTLELSAHGGASVLLTDGDSTLFKGTVSGGDRKVFTTSKRFVLVLLSDRYAVSLLLDGKPVILPESDQRGVFDYTLP
jgi:cytoskeletal protein RodZ